MALKPLLLNEEIENLQARLAYYEGKSYFENKMKYKKANYSITDDSKVGQEEGESLGLLAFNDKGKEHTQISFETDNTTYCLRKLVNNILQNDALKERHTKIQGGGKLWGLKDSSENKEVERNVPQLTKLSRGKEKKDWEMDEGIAFCNININNSKINKKATKKKRVKVNQEETDPSFRAKRDVVDYLEENNEKNVIESLIATINYYQKQVRAISQENYRLKNELVSISILQDKENQTMTFNNSFLNNSYHDDANSHHFLDPSNFSRISTSSKQPNFKHNSESVNTTTVHSNSSSVSTITSEDDSSRDGEYSLSDFSSQGNVSLGVGTTY